MALNLKQAVRDKIDSLGVKGAQEFYGVSSGTISNWYNGKTSPSLEAIEATIGDSLTTEDPTKIALTMWEGRRVAILQPVYRTFNADTHFTLFANYIKYGPDKIAVLPPRKRTVIHEARNFLIDKAMKTTKADSFIMVDDDMILPFGEAAYYNTNFEPGIPVASASLHAISRIMSHDGSNHGIVGSLYFGRHRRGKAQCAIGFENPQTNAALRQHAYHGLVETGWVGTGFIRIERWVIEKMKAEIDAGRWPECKPIQADLPYGFFSPIRVGVGEDVSFGRRAEAIGIKSYLDADLECLHNGEANYGSLNTHD